MTTIPVHRRTTNYSAPQGHLELHWPFFQKETAGTLHSHRPSSFGYDLDWDLHVCPSSNSSKLHRDISLTSVQCAPFVLMLELHCIVHCLHMYHGTKRGRTYQGRWLKYGDLLLSFSSSRRQAHCQLFVKVKITLHTIFQNVPTQDRFLIHSL